LEQQEKTYFPIQFFAEKKNQITCLVNVFNPLKSSTKEWTKVYPTGKTAVLM